MDYIKGLEMIMISSLECKGSHIAREFWFLYRFFRPEWIRNMKQNEFAILSRRGHLGVGVNGLPVWHKRAKENILRALDIKVEKGDTGEKV